MDKETIWNLSAEQIRKAMACDTPEELMKLAKDEGVSLTKEEAEAYLSEMADIDLDSAQLKQVAGGAAIWRHRPAPTGSRGGTRALTGEQRKRRARPRIDRFVVS